jgi:aspartate/methionine/tyrosine aminotransferase
MFMTVAERQSPPSPARVDAGRSPFVRLRELLGDSPPGKSAISLAVGEPQHAVPSFVGPVIAAHIAEFGRYPMNRGSKVLPVPPWLGRRSAAAADRSASEVLVLNGSAEGPFSARSRPSAGPVGSGPARDLMPNPFYGAYEAGAMAPTAAGLSAGPPRPAFARPRCASEGLLARTVAFYPPARARRGQWPTPPILHACALARRHGFLLFSDECYSEIYTQRPPASALEQAGPDFHNVVVFQSLSKRSNLPGLRVGFVAGDRRFLSAFLELRNVSSPQVPLPAQRVAIAAYADEAHVEENQRLYKLKFDLADQILGGRYGYRRPAGGFLLWLDVSQHGGDEAVTLRLWREAGLRVVPGRYLAREQADGSNPGAGYIRVALVQDQETTAEALHRLVGVLG